MLKQLVMAAAIASALSCAVSAEPVTSPNEFYDIKGQGPVAQYAPAPSPQPFPTLDISGGAAPAWTSQLYQGNGFKVLAVGVTLTRSGTLAVTRYIDAAGTVALKASPDSVSLTANTAGVLTINDNLPFQSFTVTITNTDAVAGHTAAISNYAALLNAN